MYSIKREMLSLPPNATTYERDMIRHIIKTQGQERGSLMTQLAAFADEDDIPRDRQKGRPTDLRSDSYLPNGELYGMALEYARKLYPTSNIVHDLSSERGTMLISKTCARTLSVVHVNGLRYSCLFNKRTKKDRIHLPRPF